MMHTIQAQPSFRDKFLLLMQQLRAHFVLHWPKWAAVGVLAFVFQYLFMLGVNLSPSLPQHFFLIHKGDTDINKGDYVAFKWHGQGGFYVGQPYFTKIVMGMPGDVVTVEGMKVFINGEFVTLAKPHSSTGKPMEIAKPKVLAEGEFFAYASNPNSLDSRYSVVGYISTSDIIGRAYPIF